MISLLSNYISIFLFISYDRPRRLNTTRPDRVKVLQLSSNTMNDILFCLSSSIDSVIRSFVSFPLLSPPIRDKINSSKS